MHATHSGNPLVGIALFGWLPFVVALFALLPPRRAALVAFLTGWMFLPWGGYEIKFFPEYNKVTATCAAIFIATMIFGMDRILKFKPHWLDLFPVLACVAPLFSSLSNGLGLYDGLSAMTGATMNWMFPYLIGRLYFNDLRSMRELAFGLFIAGLVYMPLCLWEIRMSPNLHYYIYGFAQSPFIMTYRGGGYRPMVFMGHGLMLAMFMAMCTLSGFGLWLSKARQTLAGFPLPLFLIPLALTTVLCKSAGALLLFLVGLACLAFIKYAKMNWPVTVLALFAVLYIVVRGSGLWSGMELVDAASAVFGEERAASLRTRVVNETALAERARERFLLGWGGWGDNRIVDEQGRDKSITDGFWIIIFGTRGIVGLTGVVGTIIGPPLLLARRIPGKFWMHPAMAPASVCALILCLWMLDCIPNAMSNPIFLVTAGGVAGLCRLKVARKPIPQARAQRRETAPLSVSEAPGN